MVAKPDVRTEELGSGDDVVILASDGLWDVLSNKDACELVKDIQVLPEAVSCLAGARDLGAASIPLQACDRAPTRGSLPHATWAWLWSSLLHGLSLSTVPSLSLGCTGLRVALVSYRATLRCSM